MVAILLGDSLLSVAACAILDADGTASLHLAIEVR
jgi:hypothetical protein